MIIRFELSDNNNKTLYLFLPMKNDSPTIFDPESIPYPWPPLTGTWKGKRFFGDLDYNEEAKTLKFTCSDGDTLETEIDAYTVLRQGSKMVFTSGTDGKVLFEVTDCEVL